MGLFFVISIDESVKDGLSLVHRNNNKEVMKNGKAL